MREEDKPFVCYRTGRWRMKIVPRNAAGYRGMFVWMLSLIPIVVVFIWAISSEPSGAFLALIVGSYILALLGWVIAMIRWMKARSEIVNLEELLALKRERDAAAKRGRQ